MSESFDRENLIEVLLSQLGIPRSPLNYVHYQGIGPYDPNFFEAEQVTRRQLEARAVSQLQAISDDELSRLCESYRGLDHFAMVFGLVDSPQWYAGGFGVEGYSPDYDHWARMDFWSLEECACLSLGFRPEKVPKYDVDTISQYDSVKFFRQRVTLIQRAPLKTLTDAGMVSPVEFINWVKRKGLEVPSELLTAVDGGGHSPRPPMLNTIDKRQYDSALKVILGLLAEHYGYRCGAISTDMKKDISSGLADLGLNLDRKTLDKVLASAIGARKGFESEQSKRDQKKG